MTRTRKHGRRRFVRAPAFSFCVLNVDIAAGNPVIPPHTLALDIWPRVARRLRRTLSPFIIVIVCYFPIYADYNNYTLLPSQKVKEQSSAARNVFDEAQQSPETAKAYFAEWIAIYRETLKGFTNGYKEGQAGASCNHRYIYIYIRTHIPPEVCARVLARVCVYTGIGNRFFFLNKFSGWTLYKWFESKHILPV